MTTFSKLQPMGYCLLFIALSWMMGSCESCSNKKPTLSKGTAKTMNGTIPRKNPPSAPLYSINAGIPNPKNSCYLNSAVQILATFYPHIFKGKTGLLAEAGSKLLRAVRQEEKVTPAEREARANQFFEVLKLKGKEGGIEWKTPHNEQGDGQELLLGILGWADLPPFNLQLMEEYPGETADKPIKIPGSVDKWIAYTLAIPPENATKNILQAWVNYNLQRSQDQLKDNSDQPALPNKRYYVCDKLDNLADNILPIVINRFEYGIDPTAPESEKDKERTVKINRLVDGALDGLTIPAGHLMDANEDWHYQLVGFMVHRGTSANSGHYIAYVKVADDQWIEYNDQQVNTMDDLEVKEVAKEAYVFFYKKLDKITKAASGA
eukprot:gene733-907_t